jgi:hypothetical protein
MGARLINVRLAAGDERLVRELRARGVSISDVVRRALRAEAKSAEQAPVDADALIKEMLERFPAPAGPSRKVGARTASPSAGRKRPDATDRHAMREHIAARLRARR